MSTSEERELKSLPFNLIAEKAILGAMLIDNSYVNLVFSTLKSDDFYSNSHKLISASISNLVEQGSKADIVTVCDELEKQGKLKIVGGISYVSSLVDEVPENINVSEYIRIVKDNSSLREIIRASYEVIENSTGNDADVESILGKLHDNIISISSERLKGGFVDTGSLTPIVLEKIEQIQKRGESLGIKTGFIDLDEITSGFHNSELIVIAARPSMGKTAIALNIALNMALKQDKSVGFFTIEMDRTQILMRMLAVDAKISLKSLRSGKPRLTQEDWGKLELSATAISKSKIFIDDSAPISIIELKTRARRLKSEKKLDIIFVDYLQLIELSKDMDRKNYTLAQQIGKISAALKSLAKELEIPVVALAQLNRAPEHRGTSKKKGGSESGIPRYQLSDLRESGNIEQDADLIIFLHRQEQIDHDTERKGIADLIIAKQRNGPTGRIELAYISEYTKFSNYEYIVEENV